MSLDLPGYVRSGNTINSFIHISKNILSFSLRIIDRYSHIASTRAISAIIDIKGAAHNSVGPGSCVSVGSSGGTCTRSTSNRLNRSSIFAIRSIINLESRSRTICHGNRISVNGASSSSTRSSSDSLNRGASRSSECGQLFGSEILIGKWITLITLRTISYDNDIFASVSHSKGDLINSVIFCRNDCLLNGTNLKPLRIERLLPLLENVSILINNVVRIIDTA